MLGAIIGDVIGSVHEWAEKIFRCLLRKSTFTDDTVLTVAVAEWILNDNDLTDVLQSYTVAYPGRGYGLMYGQWAANRHRKPYNQFWQWIRNARQSCGICI